MTSRVDFGWKPAPTAIFVGIRHVGVNAPHHFSQKPPLKCSKYIPGEVGRSPMFPQKQIAVKASFSRNMLEPGGCRPPHITDSNENRCGGRFPPKINSGDHILAKY